MAKYTVLANAILVDQLIPTWQKQPSQWYLEGKIADESYFGGLTWYANRNFYLDQAIDFSSDTSQIQQAIQLWALGDSTVDRRNENVRQDKKDIEIQARAQKFQDQLDAMNLRVSQQLVDLGQAITDKGSGGGFINVTVPELPEIPDLPKVDWGFPDLGSILPVAGIPISDPYQPANAL